MKINLTLVLMAWACFGMAQTSPPQLLSKPTNNENFLSIQWLGLVLHPYGSRFPEYYPRKLDARAYTVWTPGVVVNYDKQHTKRLFWRMSASIYKDCRDVWAGFVHLGFRFNYLTLGRHSFNFGFGPSLFVRQDWHTRFEGYPAGDFYDKNVYGDWQYKFALYGGEFEYQYTINNKKQITYSMIPAYPAAIISKIGFRWQL